MKVIFSELSNAKFKNVLEFDDDGEQIGIMSIPLEEWETKRKQLVINYYNSNLMNNRDDLWDVITALTMMVEDRS